MNQQISIIFVVFSKSNYSFLELNYKLISKLNPDSRVNYLVIDNSPEQDKIKINKSKYKIIPGVEYPKNIPRKFSGSYHHALGINKALSSITTKYLLVLDCDLFIVYPNWIDKVLSFMRLNDLTFFGTPYHPKRFNKYRYFPSAQCLFIDTSTVDIKKLDFRPDYSENELKSDSKTNYIIKFIDKYLIQSRLQIGSSRDTGYKIYKKYEHNPKIRFQYVNPILSSQTSFKFSSLNRLLEILLPDRLRFIPKKAGYLIKNSFLLNYNFEAIQIQDFEEYFWGGQPFAIHIQGLARGKDFAKYFSIINKTVDNFIKLHLRNGD